MGLDIAETDWRTRHSIDNGGILAEVFNWPEQNDRKCQCDLGRPNNLETRNNHLPGKSGRVGL
jgi:hypothetical protein